MHILTFDIEDWFHILDNEETGSPSSWNNFESRIIEGINRILELLDRTDQNATFFCLGWIAEKYPEAIKKISDLGYEIGSHSFNHQLIYNQSSKTFSIDLSRSIESIEQITGKKVRIFRAPGFSITNNSLWAFDILSELGIEIDCSIFPAARAHGGFPDFENGPNRIITLKNKQLKSFPINTTSFFGKSMVYSGGGYFRLLPYWYLKYRFKKDPYVMTYFHPRDFDSKQPIVPGLSSIRKFKSYVGLSKALSKLENILLSQKFLSIHEAESLTEWSKTPIVNLDTIG